MLKLAKYHNLCYGNSCCAEGTTLLISIENYKVLLCNWREITCKEMSNIMAIDSHRTRNTLTQICIVSS